MARFLFKTVTFSALIFSILISINYFGDSAKLFDSTYEKSIAKILRTGDFVTNINNYDERILQREVIGQMERKLDLLIIGSSRTMLINEDMFDGVTLYNSSVSGASIEDLIGIYQLYKSKNLLPKKILLGIDPWYFNENNGQTRWLSLEKEYRSFFKNSNNNSEKSSYKLEKYKQLISASYFQSSIRNIPRYIVGKTMPELTKEKFNRTITILEDGSLVYGNEHRLVSEDEVSLRAKRYIEGDIYSIENFKRKSKKHQELFESLIENIKSNNIEITFFLAPYHSLVFSKIKNGYPMVLEIEKYLTQFALDENIEIVGSYNPSKIGLIEKHFYDGMHCTDEAIKLILNKEHLDQEKHIKPEK